MYVSDEFLVSVLLLLLPLWKFLLYLFFLLILNFTYVYFVVHQVLHDCAILDNLCTYLQSIVAGHLSNLCFLGDFNSCSHPLYSNLCSITLLFSLTQVVVGPTHVHHDGSTSTIDLVFVPDTSLVNNCSTSPPLSNSDHYGIGMELNRKPKKAAKAKSG